MIVRYKEHREKKKSEQQSLEDELVNLKIENQKLQNLEEFCSDIVVKLRKQYLKIVTSCDCSAKTKVVALSDLMVNLLDSDAVKVINEKSSGMKRTANSSDFNQCSKRKIARLG